MKSLSYKYINHINQASQPILTKKRKRAISIENEEQTPFTDPLPPLKPYQIWATSKFKLK